MLIHNDSHLNIFWNYNDNGNVHLENNITKALINTIDLLPKKDKCEVISYLAEIPLLKEDKARFEFYLQSKPGHSPYCVNAFPEEKRIQLAISPTGKCWGNGILNLDMDLEKNLVISKIKSMLSPKGENVDKDELQRRAEAEYDCIIDRGGSIPDAWILIYNDKVPEYCIIVENKLYDLNPYQLRNHTEKSLLLDGKTQPIFKSFDSIYNNLLNYTYSSPVVSHMLEYFSLLGYEPISGFNNHDFSVINNAEDNKSKEHYLWLLRRKMFKYLEGFISTHYPPDNYYYDRDTSRLWMKNSSDRFNIYFDFNQEKGILSISSEIGVNRKYINKNVLPKLKNNSTYSEIIKNLYGNSSYYVRYIRLNKISQSMYFWIQEYDNLEAYLSSFQEDEIYMSKISKSDCVALMKSLTTSIDLSRLESYAHKDWNKLEYLRIIDDISIKDHCNRDNELENMLSETINKHIAGLEKFEYIYTSAAACCTRSVITLLPD